jgi:cell division septum initiation protein DivIVA
MAQSWSNRPHDEGNRQFIAAARTEFPAALDEIERLQAERDALAAQLAQIPECYRRAVSSSPTIQTDDGDIGGTC